jgi:hypothetical protein
MSGILWINVLLAAAFIAAWAGLPLWLVLRHSEPKPQTVAAPAVRTLPEPRVHASYRRAA